MGKKIYAPVNGVARNVKKMYVPVNGTARKVKKAYKGVNGKARLVFVETPTLNSSFANNTWENIILACQLGVVPNTWAVGNQKTMTINATEYVVVIIGKNHDYYANGSGTAPLTFQLLACYNTRYVMNESQTNSGGWGNSDMRYSRLPEIFRLMPLEVQNAVREVYKETSAGDQSTDLYGTADKLFLLSESEVFGKATNSASGEGEQYAYYATGGTTSKTKRVNGVISEWWTRSPYKANSVGFCAVNKDRLSDGFMANNATGVSFAFCF